ncbi:PhzF family phenazine biosynthesis isomerase [Streptomyces sp. Q6]|uniref:PhzF family phenazine biosynthesis isomerase n=1 Tax=Streptomyces citrinus TaxID=3118173 RepID=A0ACD5ANX6_9ACTN
MTRQRTHPVSVVHACLRDGRGGSPTAVLDDDPRFSDAERQRIPALLGTSHAVFLGVAPGGTGADLRFFTATGELPACGHGTVAALAVLTRRTGGGAFTLRTPVQSFAGRATPKPDGDEVDATFETGPVRLREATDPERHLTYQALRFTPDTRTPEVRVAALGRERMLVPVSGRAALAALQPDLDRLRRVCDRFGLLGVYVHTPPDSDGRAAARMFAPSIGVPEDVANANSTACLAAHLGERGVPRIAVDMGDRLGRPATVTGASRTTASGTVVQVGGAARVDRVVTLDPAQDAPHRGGRSGQAVCRVNP